MRISDWSSDVCSSDLRRLNRISTSLEERRAGRYRQYLFRWRAPDAPNAQFRFQLSASPDGSSPLVDEIGLTEPVLILTDLPKGTYYWRVVSTETAHGDIYRKASQLRRSEEHPSEIQSLMSISYAVFCYKTKNK